MFERFTRNARVAIVLAQQDTRELSADEIRPEHLLVGVLQSAGRELSSVLSGYGLTVEGVRDRVAAGDARAGDSFDDDADALRSIGIDLGAVRENVDRTFGPDAFDHALGSSSRRGRRGHVPFAKSTKKALELALREALAHKDNWIGCEHLLLGLLRGGDPVAMGLITEHVATAELRGGVVALLDAAA